jgi:uncharacterized protein YegL
MRRLPIYFLVDTCLSMSGQNAEKVTAFIAQGVKNILSNPIALETVYYNFTTYGNDKVSTSASYESIINFEPRIFNCSGYSNINYGIEAVKDHYNIYFTESSIEIKGDWKPILIIFPSIAPSTKIDNKLLEFIKTKFQSVYIITSDNEFVIKSYSSYFSNVLHLENLDNNIFSQLFNFIEDSIVDFNELPPPPNQLIFPI